VFLSVEVLRRKCELDGARSIDESEGVYISVDVELLSQLSLSPYSAKIRTLDKEVYRER